MLVRKVREQNGYLFSFSPKFKRWVLEQFKKLKTKQLEKHLFL